MEKLINFVDKSPSLFVSENGTKIILLEQGSDNQTYYFIKEPNKDNYTELFGSKYNSATGNQFSTRVQNIYVESDYLKEINIFVKGDDMFLNNGSLSFHFLKKQSENDCILELYNEYLPLPDERVSHYCYKDINNNIVYIDNLKYDFKYKNYRLFVIENDNVKQHNIIDFKRYRDGGTTIIKTESDEFYFPVNMFNNSEKFPTWNGVEIVKIESESDLKRIENLIK